jgi:glycosyltransferase 2 family protein
VSLGSMVFWFAMGFFSEVWSDRMAERLEGTPKVGPSLAELWRAVWLYRRRGQSVALALGLSLISHFGFVLTFHNAVHAVVPTDEIPSPQTHLLAVPVGMVIQAGVPTPGGVGGGEVGFGWLYKKLGYAFAAGTLGSLSLRAITWIIGFLGYLVYLRMRRTLVPVPPGEQADPCPQTPVVA